LQVVKSISGKLCSILKPKFKMKQFNEYPYISYQPEILNSETVLLNSKSFYDKMDGRRSVREFSDMPVSQEVIEQIILTASSAPSGAHKQPWTFVAVQNPLIKTEIRKAAEKEEYESYQNRMTDEWLDDLKPLGTNWQKPFLEVAPWLIVMFAQITSPDKKKHYYVQESCGIAAGFLIAAIHQAGLCTLTHTPSPMNFLKKILNRPDHERPYLLLPVGYASADCYVPDIQRKTLSEVSVFI
jgi:iodotyrosine deiodinase